MLVSSSAAAVAVPARHAPGRGRCSHASPDLGCPDCRTHWRGPSTWEKRTALEPGSPEWRGRYPGRHFWAKAHVESLSVWACRTKAWHFHRYPPEHPAGQGPEHRAFRCRSWRHAGRCRADKAHEDRQRIAAALGELPLRDLSFFVLTVRPPAREPKRPGALLRLQRLHYRRLWRAWQSLRQFLRRKLGPEPIRYVATVESTRRGWPHLNVVTAHARLAALVRGWQPGAPGGGPEGRSKSWFRRAVVRAGFGFIVWAEPARSADDLAAYIVKLAYGDLKDAPPPAGSGGAPLAGELAKLTQLPLRAARHFRRLRASRGFLPPPKRPPKLAGLEVEIMRMPAEACCARCRAAALREDEAGPPASGPRLCAPPRAPPAAVVA